MRTLLVLLAVATFLAGCGRSKKNGDAAAITDVEISGPDSSSSR